MLAPRIVNTSVNVVGRNIAAIDRTARLRDEVSAEIIAGLATRDRTELARLLRVFLATTPDGLR